MSQPTQRRQRIALKRGFEHHVPTLLHAPARRVDCRLRILFVQHNAQRQLQVALRLHRPAHNAERHERRALRVERESRDNGMERALAARHHVGMRGIEREARAAILQTDAGARHHHAGAKAHKVRLNKRDHHAAGIGGAEIDGAALLRRAEDEVARALRID